MAAGECTRGLVGSLQRVLVASPGTERQHQRVAHPRRRRCCRARWYACACMCQARGAHLDVRRPWRAGGREGGREGGGKREGGKGGWQE